MARKLAPIHPGEMLREVLEDANLTANSAALAMRVPSNRLTAILNGKRNITADTALRLGRLFGTSAIMWLNLQTKYDLDVAEDATGEAIVRDVRAF
jgi:addiction module HigA family antidote